MIHLIYTSIPLEQIPEEYRSKFEDAVRHWGNNHSFYENEPSLNFQIRKIRDQNAKERLEWRRIFNRVLHIPDVFGECDLTHHGFSAWFKYVQDVAVATDVQFRKNSITRFSALDEKSWSSIGEVSDADGLNRLQLHMRPHEVGHRFMGDIKWFQGYVVFFLETAAIYHLAEQALKLGQGNLGNPRVLVMCEKLERIQRICNLQDSWTRKKEQE